MSESDFSICSSSQESETQNTSFINFKSSITSDYKSKGIVTDELPFNEKDVIYHCGIKDEEVEKKFAIKYLRKSPVFQDLRRTWDDISRESIGFLTNPKNSFRKVQEIKNLGYPVLKKLLEKDSVLIDDLSEELKQRKKFDEEKILKKKSEEIIENTIQKSIFFMTDEHIYSIKKENKIVNFQVSYDENGKNKIFYFDKIFYSSFSLKDLILEHAKRGISSKKTSLKMFEFEKSIFYVFSFTEFSNKDENFKIFPDFTGMSNCGFVLKSFGLDFVKGAFLDQIQAIDIQDLKAGNYVTHKNSIYEIKPEGELIIFEGFKLKNFN